MGTTVPGSPASGYHRRARGDARRWHTCITRVPARRVSRVASTAQPLQVVKVTAEDGVNVREKRDANAAILLKADYGAEFPFLELDVTGTDGASH